MKGKELAELASRYPDFEFEFIFTDGYSTFPNIRRFINLQLGDIGYSEKTVSLDGEEK